MIYHVWDSPKIEKCTCPAADLPTKRSEEILDYGWLRRIGFRHDSDRLICIGYFWDQGPDAGKPLSFQQYEQWMNAKAKQREEEDKY